MNLKKPLVLTTFLALSIAAPLVHAAVITFDTLVTGATSFGYDGDGDGINDVVFSTTDPFGFNTVGPGTNMTHIDEPGIEGTTALIPDLRVDFLNGAVGPLSFGFAMSTATIDPATSVTFSVFDAADLLLTSTTVPADFTVTFPPSGLSSFPEALATASFGGIAAYALFDFDPTNASRYIIDNFTGTFGSTEVITPVPEPGMLALLGLGLFGMVVAARKRLHR